MIRDGESVDKCGPNQTAACGSGAHSHIRGLGLDDALEARNVSQVHRNPPPRLPAPQYHLPHLRSRFRWERFGLLRAKTLLACSGHGRANECSARCGRHPIDDPRGQDRRACGADRRSARHGQDRAGDGDGAGACTSFRKFSQVSASFRNRFLSIKVVRFILDVASCIVCVV